MQKTVIIMACWFAALSPLAARAADVDYPALGIKLTDLPEGAKALDVGETLQGYRARIEFGGEATSAEISRFDKAVPEGNIAESSFRGAVFKQVGILEAHGSINKLVTIAGQPAWMTGSAQGFGPKEAAYQCYFYLVVGQHLYEIAVLAVGTKDSAESGFNAAVKTIASGLAFEPVERQPDKALAPGEMPLFLMGSQVGRLYSDRARRLGEQGIVLLEFNIDGGGVAQGVKVKDGANADLADTAKSLLKSGGFKVPQGWEQGGGSKQSFTMEFRYELRCPPDHPLPEVVPDAQVETICGSTLPR